MNEVRGRVPRGRGRRTGGVLLSALAGIACLALPACSSGGSLSASGSYFQGLPPSVVAEFLDNPSAKQNMSGMSGHNLESLAQAGVRNMIFCREELRAYEQWLNTGRPPPIVPGPVPAHPLEPGNSAIKQDYASLRSAIQTGDPTQLHVNLTANGSCGQWVPARPGTKTPTIAQVVGRQHA